MNKHLLIIIFPIFFTKMYSQEQQKFDYELLGALVLEANHLISYKIEFNTNKKGVIFGYSYTDMGGEDETKSYIRGHYNARSKEIQFTERDILYTKSKYLPEEFCFVKFQGKFKESSKKKLLDGKFVGIYNDLDTCATGRIELVSTKFIEKRFEKLYKKIKKSKKIDSVIKEKFEPKKYLTKFSETKIKSGEKISVFVYTNKMKIHVWDYGIQDGDIISIYNNDTLILENYTVSKKKKSLSIDLKDGKNVFKIKTISSGRIKTNTVKLKLFDYRRQYEVIADLDEGKYVEINIIKLKIKNNSN